MESGFKATTVRECWQIASDVAETYQELMNRLDPQEKTTFLLLKRGRDTASDIAWRIKNGEKHENSNT